MDVSHLPIFAGLSEADIQDALAHFRVADVEFGMKLMEEGEEDSTMLCVVSGELEIRTGDTLLGTAGPGAVVGEMALFGFGMRMATVEALTNAELLLLDRDGYKAMRALNSPVCVAVEKHALHALMRRLKDTSDRIAELADGHPAGSMVPSKTFLQRVAGVFGAGGRRRIDTLDRVGILTSAPFFKEADVEAVKQLAEHMTGVEFSPGEFVVREGELGDEMFIVAEGMLDVLINTGDDRVEPLASLEPGDAFGMLALLGDRPRMASCVARSEVACLCLNLDSWTRLIDANSPAATGLRGALVRCLSDQLAFANARLSQLDLTQRRTVERDASLRRMSAGMDTYGPLTRDSDA